MTSQIFGVKLRTKNFKMKQYNPFGQP